jgi:hypothetical protein
MTTLIAATLAMFFAPMGTPPNAPSDYPTGQGEVRQAMAALANFPNANLPVAGTPTNTPSDYPTVGSIPLPVISPANLPNAN